MPSKKQDPWEVVWWHDEDGNVQQVTRASAPEGWTEITKGFPLDAGEEAAAQSAESNQVEE